MQTVVDFLLEYYIWILVILVILLITVVGFLADTKKKKKLREQKENVNNDAMNNSFDANNNQGMNFNGINQNMNTGFDNYNQNISNYSQDNMMNQNLNNNMMNPINDNMMNNQNINLNSAVVPNMNQNLNTINSFENNANNVMPEQNKGINNSNNNDSFFIPASEQTPRFEAREVSIPKLVEPTPIVENRVNSVPTAVVEPTEVPNTIVQNMNQNVIPQMTSPAPEPLQATNVSITPNVQSNQMPINNQTVTPIPSVMPNMVNPETIPNSNPQVQTPVEPINQNQQNQMNGISGKVANNTPNMSMPLPNVQNNTVQSQNIPNNMGQYNNSVPGGVSFVMNGQVPNNQNNNNWNL